MKRYRYVTVGTFQPQNKQFLADGDFLRAIEIPSLHLFNSEEAAKAADCFLEYRFGLRDGKVGLCVFPDSSDVDIVKDKNGKEYLVNRVDGINEIASIDYLTFKNLGGEIYNIPKWATCNIAPFFGNDFHKFE